MPSRRLGFGSVSVSLGHPILQQNYKKDIAENEYFEDNAKCWAGGYAHLRGITRCEATPAPKSLFERKTEGREVKSTTFRTSL